MTETSIKKALKDSICSRHSGKMEHMQSISTSAAFNEFCRERAKNPLTVCHKCYANTLIALRKNLADKLARNTALWCNTLYSSDYLPTIKAEIFRLESFGDLQNSVQAENYMSLCDKNPGTTFALWTKNPFILWDALKKRNHRKPRNLIVIFSSPVINHCGNNIVNLYIMPNGKPMIDKVFTVYDKETAKRENVRINCGKNKCFNCRKCYSRRTTKFINELLK